MSAIPLVDADGRDPLPICRRNRDWLISYYKSPESIVLRFFSDAAPVRQKDKSEEVRPGIVLDFNERNQVVGIEILRAKERVPLANLRQIQFEVA